MSGKGVPAALFMAEVTRMFRTLVDGRLLPNAIATRLNHALAEDNDQGMFVTMFIGLINIKSGHMAFCNAGHNPPLLDGEFMQMEPNAPIGLWPKRSLSIRTASTRPRTMSESSLATIV